MRGFRIAEHQLKNVIKKEAEGFLLAGFIGSLVGSIFGSFFAFALGFFISS